MNRQQHHHLKLKTSTKIMLWIASLLLICSPLGFYFATSQPNKPIRTLPETAPKTQDSTPADKAKTPETTETKATITASGDMLYHYVVFGGAYNDGEKRYDLDNDFEQLATVMDRADLCLGDFEGTINPAYPLSGFPMFNAPEDVVKSIQKAGFDVVDLAHNHILDTGLEGLNYTAKAFEKADIATIGVNPEGQNDILIKEINGIKVALLAYAYGFNGMENNLSQADYDKYLHDLNMEKVAADLQKAEELADITVVMPQLGTEYALAPTEEQQSTYRKMIDLGADIIFGGHPHVAEPTEIIEKDGQQKFIIYSMGNLLSNQRYETIQNYWGERGVLMELELTKKGDKTTISNILPHPTWVSKEPIEGVTYTQDGTVNQAYDYQVYLAEDYLPEGRYADQVPAEKRQRIETAYHEMMALLDLKWPESNITESPQTTSASSDDAGKTTTAITGNTSSSTVEKAGEAG